MTDSIENSCPRCGAPIAEDAPQGLCPKCVLEGAATVPDSQPRKRTPAPSIEELALHFPDLEILELIGSGGMGAVYRARQPKLDRIVALKILSHDLGEDPAFAERFQREARVLARLSHPNIVAVHDTGSAGPYAFLLMEYVDGVNLRQAMRTGGFTPSEALGLVEEICGALKFAHAEGILHRDIKPENILLDSRGQVKIADFGIAKLVDQEDAEDLTLTMEGSILGSPQYMAPEQIETPGDVDQRADIYSLGVVLYEMLTGELPIGRFALPSEKSDLDSRIDEIVLRTLAKEREARFQSAGEVRIEVEAITQSPAKESTRRGSGRDVLHPEKAPRKSAGGDSMRETARFATGSAILTGVSIPPGLVYGIPLISGFMVAGFQESGSRIGAVEAMIILAMFLAIFGILPVLGFTLGVLTLREIRQSGGLKRGMGRALFGTLTWPVLLIIAATVALSASYLEATGHEGYPRAVLPTFVIVITGVLGSLLLVRTVVRWAKDRNDPGRAAGSSGGGIALWALTAVFAVLVSYLVLTTWILPVPQQAQRSATQTMEPPPAWRNGRPEVELDLVVEPGLVATIEFLRTDESGEAQETPDYLDRPGGYVIASDAEPWRGTVELGSLAGVAISYGPRWLLKIDGSQTDYSHVGAWESELDEPIKLELSSPGIHRFQVAKGRSDRDHPGLLTLQVTAAERTVPGIPASVMEQHQQEGFVASAGDLDWMAQVRKDLEEQGPDLPEGNPEVDLRLKVGPRLAATYELVRMDAVGNGRAFEEHQGFILASDEEPWEGRIRFAAESLAEDTGSWRMTSSISSDSQDEVVTLPGENSTVLFDLEWTWKNEPLKLELSEPGQQVFHVASRSDLSQTLVLRVEAQRREVPAVPAAEFDRVTLPVAVRGQGGDIGWIRYLMEELEKSLKAAGVPEMPGDPEPEWREGKPESHVNLTIDPGVVAEIELTAPDGSGGTKTYHHGYIVASDLKPWVGKLRVGSLADSDKIQWRIDGPYGSMAADIDPGWDWQVEPLATNSEVAKPDGLPTVQVIAAGTARTDGDTLVSFVVKPTDRKRVQADLPEVLADHFMYLGDGPGDWIEDIKFWVKDIEMMTGNEPEEPSESE